MIGFRDANIRFASVRRFRRHIRRSEPLIDELVAGGRRSAPVLAILIVETFYRPRALRLGEYLAWLLLSALRPAWAARISIGLAQVQLRHWHTLGILDGIRFSRERLAVVRNPARNYEVCERFLQASGVERTDGPALMRAYVGAARPGFVALFDQASSALAGREGAVAAPADPDA